MSGRKEGESDYREVINNLTIYKYRVYSKA